MKKNRRKKEKGVHGTPQVNKEATAKAQITFVNFSKDLKPKLGEASEPIGLQVLRDADVIIAISGDGNRIPLYGTEWLQEVAAGKIDETVVKKMVLVALDAEEFDQQIEELRTIVVELKGSCCYEGHAEDTDEGWYMFIRNGNIMYYADGDKHGMILARSRSMAEQHADWYQKNHGDRLSIAKIGTVPGETLKVLLDRTFKEGATCAFVVRSINETGALFDVLLPPEQSPGA